MTWRIWQIFTRALERLKIGTLIGSFYPKKKIYELRSYRGAMCYDNEEWCKIWGKIDLSFQKWPEKLDEFWFKYSKVSKMCTLMSSFWPKHIIFELKTYRGAMSHETKERCKIWRKAEHLKVSKFGLWWDPFIESRKCMHLKFTEQQLCLTATKNDTKFEEVLTCRFKIDLKKLKNYDPSTEKSQKFAL